MKIVWKTETLIKQQERPKEIIVTFSPDGSGAWHVESTAGEKVAISEAAALAILRHQPHEVG